MHTSDDPYGVREFLLKDALAEEERNRTVKAWSTFLLVMAGGYFLGLGLLLLIFSKLVYPLPFIEQEWYSVWVMSVPTSVLIFAGSFGLLVSNKNSVMDLRPHEIVMIQGHPGAWHNLPRPGKILLAIFGGAMVLGITCLSVRIAYRLLT